MSLERLAKELEETARQTGDMAATITEALQHLGEPAVGQEKTRNAALQKIIIALQAQDRIEQRCHNLAAAVRALIISDEHINHQRFDNIWKGLKLDELAIPALSGATSHTTTDGECELF